MPWLSEAFSKKRAMWNSWQIITDEGIVTHHSRNHAYCSITSDDWFDWCQQRFHSAATTTEIIKLPVTNTDKNILMTSDHKKNMILFMILALLRQIRTFYFSILKVWKSKHQSQFLILRLPS
ncbi:MAG: hypothetical protein CM15mP117_18180 [Alphaproteobacteria bacterium]|nr:MAG: hypothetical protein CM15mP117_18180 [Alphaproteobacteria bacterium]